MINSIDALSSPFVSVKISALTERTMDYRLRRLKERRQDDPDFEINAY